MANQLFSPETEVDADFQIIYGYTIGTPSAVLLWVLFYFIVLRFYCDNKWKQNFKTGCGQLVNCHPGNNCPHSESLN